MGERGGWGGRVILPCSSTESRTFPGTAVQESLRHGCLSEDSRVPRSEPHSVPLLCSLWGIDGVLDTKKQQLGPSVRDLRETVSRPPQWLSNMPAVLT